MAKRKTPAQLDHEIVKALGTSLYQDLRAAGLKLDHHESDLYVLDTPSARELIARHGKKGTGFTSQIDGKRWLDVPFAYDPFWEKKQKAQRGTPSGERTVEAATRKPRSHATKKSKKAGTKRPRYVELQWTDPNASADRKFRAGSYHTDILAELLDALYDFGRGVRTIYTDDPAYVRSVAPVHMTVQSLY